MELHYSIEKNVQLLVAHLKAHGIKKVVASPGTQHMAFLGSIQSDPFFKIYSCVDERSAAYMAVGMAAESGEPVVITCTGATASRNYMSALTEAFYRKLPLIAVTGSHEQYTIGHLVAQQIDRNRLPADIVVHSELIEQIHEPGQAWDVEIKLNRALHALTRNGGGPIHLNLETHNNNEYSVKELPKPRIINYISVHDRFPEIMTGKIAVFCGSHNVWSKELTEAVDKFCKRHNAVVLCDHTSNYQGAYRVQAPILGSQEQYHSPAIFGIDLLIHIGQTTGAYDVMGPLVKAKKVWRVCEDGATRDTFKALDCVFDMRELDFFKYYANHGTETQSPDSYLRLCKEEYDQLISAIPSDLPLSNLWIAYHLSALVPDGVVMHFSILNSLRSWDYFVLPKNVTGFSNVGGFGIDGPVSTLVGASLCHPDKLYIGVIGDLSFFYDMNSIGNRHIGSNVRIMMINNGRGQEFRNHIQPAYSWHEKADKYVAAAGHFGNKSVNLMRHMAEDLGYEYMSANSKDEVLEQAKHFFTTEKNERPIFFEIFTDTTEETEALYKFKNMKTSIKQQARNIVSEAIKKTLGENAVNAAKKLIK
jgi:2-succinyl-5-enolpyruvyl-6-hydroxy-3-cyclohexene-1-carboxylate synthase